MSATCKGHTKLMLLTQGDNSEPGHTCNEKKWVCFNQWELFMNGFKRGIKSLTYSKLTDNHIFIRHWISIADPSLKQSCLKSIL